MLYIKLGNTLPIFSFLAFPNHFLLEGALVYDTGRRRWHPLQYSLLENPRDGGAWWAAVHGVAKSRTQLSDFTSLHFTVL